MNTFRLLPLLALSIALAIPAYGRERIQGWCQQGDRVITVNTTTSSPSTPVQRSFPSCTVTVFTTGTTDKPTIYSNNTGTTKSNPFTAATTGYWFFYVDDGNYDVQFSGGGISPTYSFPAVSAMDPYYYPPGSPSTPRLISDKLSDTVSVKDYGAVGDGVTDDHDAIQAAFDDAEDKCIQFPGGTYKISEYVNLLVSNSCLLGGSDVLIDNDFGGLGYPKDGFRIGNASSMDGGTGVGINIEKVIVTGFRFTDTRIGVWVVYCRFCSVSEIWADGQAVVAAGNDLDDQCENVSFRNIYRSAANTTDWYTAAVFQTTYFQMDGIFSPYQIQSQAVAVAASQYGSVTNVYVDQGAQGSYDGIALLNARYVTVSNFVIRRARHGVVMYFDLVPTTNCYCSISNGVVTDSSSGLRIYSKSNTITGITTAGNTASVILESDGTNNMIDGNNFTEGILTDASSVYSANRWGMNRGILQNYFSDVMRQNTTLNTYDFNGIAGGGTRYQMWLAGNGGGTSTEIMQLYGAFTPRGGSQGNQVVAGVSIQNTDTGSTSGGYLKFQTRGAASTYEDRVYIPPWAGIQLNGALGLPTCDSAHRGTIYYGAAGAGVQDTLLVCAKSNADVYAWRTIY